MADGTDATIGDWVGDERDIVVTVTIPDLEAASDAAVAEFAHHRDGRWSAQTKDLLSKFQTTRLDLNSSWASTWTGWTCPCCKRGKVDIARLSPGGVVLCRLEFHHDHLADRARRIFREANPRGDDREINIQSDRAKTALLVFVERFEETLICIDCNLSEGKAKAELSGEVERDFTFTPSEIASFIRIAPNKVHEVDIDKARSIWLSAREDVAARLDFASRMAKRVAAGRHRREVSSGRRIQGYLEERDVVFSQFLRATRRRHRNDLGLTLEIRSISNDSAGRSPKLKRKGRAVAPTDAEFAEFDRVQQKHASWARAGESWTCAGCDRSKREIVRKSNSAKWTGHIHTVREYAREERKESLRWRRLYHPRSTIIGSDRRVTVCQDCRNVVSEVRRRSAGLTEDCLTVNDVRALVGSAMANSMHDIDWDDAIVRALANRSFVEAISEYSEHRRLSGDIDREVRFLAKSPGWSRSKAKEVLGSELATANDLETEEGEEYVEWLLDEAERLEMLQ